MTKKPLIELDIDEMDEFNPTYCSPYVWIVRIVNQDGCAVDVDYYTPEEASGKLRDFLSKIPTLIFRRTFEAVNCKLHNIEKEEAIDAIVLAFSRYFEEGDALHVDASQFTINRDIDFKITTVWDGEIDRFTLLANGELEYPTA